MVDPSSTHPFASFGSVGSTTAMRVTANFGSLFTGRTFFTCEDVAKGGGVMYTLDANRTFTSATGRQLATLDRRNSSRTELKLKSPQGDFRYLNFAPLFRPPEGCPNKRYLAQFTVYWKENPRFLVMLQPGSNDSFTFYDLPSFQIIGSCRLVQGDITKIDKHVYHISVHGESQDCALLALLNFAIAIFARRAKELPTDE